MSLAMSKAEREAFLAETHVGVLSITEDGRGPLTLPMWYRYEPGGDVRISTGGGSKKATLLRQAGRASMVVQSETPPYQYVSIEGPVTVGGKPDFDSDIKEMAHRYLGEQMGAMYLEMTAAERENAVLVRLTPERWITVDYQNMAEQAGA